LATRAKEHVSAFQEPRGKPSPIALFEREKYSAASATRGAIFFFWGHQILLILTLLFQPTSPAHISRWQGWSQPPSEFVRYAFIAFTAGVVFLWNLGSDPGRIHSSIDSSASPVNPDGVPLRWCKDCEVWQPIRTKHCDKCGFCVRKYDHHCFWIGTCCGEHNHGRFFVLLIAINTYVIYAAHLMLDSIFLGSLFRTPSHEAITSFFETHWAPLLWIALAVLFEIFAGILLVYHAYLLATNQTTWETSSAARITYLQHIKREAPFSRGLPWNVRYIIMGPREMDWVFAKN
jgi:palmitoyltransferase